MKVSMMIPVKIKNIQKMIMLKKKLSRKNEEEMR